MIRKLLAALGAGTALSLAPAAAQPVPAASPAAETASGRPSFDIDIHAPSAVKTLLERHLELRRYREVTDLDDAELARLVAITEGNVRELVGTLGYFSPDIRVTREP